MKKLLLFSVLSISLIQGMQQPEQIGLGELPPDVKRIILGMLIYKDESKPASKADVAKAARDLKSYLLANTSSARLFNEKAMQDIIVAFADSWTLGNYVQAADVLLNTQVPATPVATERVNSLIKNWRDKYMVFSNAVEEENLERTRDFIQQKMPVTALIHGIFEWDKDNAKKERKLKVLINAGVNEQIINNLRQMYDLFRAAKYGDLETINRLIASGIDLNKIDLYGNTALMIATRQIKPNIVRALIKAGANVNKQDEHGRSPLWHSQSHEISQLLLDAGANPNLRDINGKSALDVRKGYNDKAGMDLLIQRGAQ